MCVCVCVCVCVLCACIEVFTMTKFNQTFSAWQPDKILLKLSMLFEL